MAFGNGLIPLDQMTRLSVGGGYLLPAAAQNFETWRAVARNAGWNLSITSAADAFRTYAIQERIFRERYTTAFLAGRPAKTWNGVRWYLRKGYATAAVPGTSNHGKGLAVDIKNAGGFNGAFYKWMASTGPAFGWSNTEGRSIDEPWHWVNDNVARGAIGAVAGTISETEEDDMTPDQDARLARIEAALKYPEQPYTYFQAMQGQFTNVLDRLIKIGEAVHDRNGTGYLPVPGQPFGYPAATHNALAALIAEVSALRTVLGSVGSGDGLSPDELQALAEAAAKKAVEGLEGTITFKK